MKRILCLLAIVCYGAYLYAQDFASRFMEGCQDNSHVQCQTISPRMMGKLMQPQDNEDEDKEYESYLISRLKSARIITADKNARHLYNQAMELIGNNRNRFTPLYEHNEEQYTRIYVRRNKSIIRELVMLELNPKKNLFVVVNFTGEMDDKFISILAKGKVRNN